jgi:Secretion system C-terminal sorting domain
MRYIIGIFFIAVVTSGFAQSLERSVVSTSGGFVNPSVMSLEYTIGETAVGYFSNSSLSITEGFNQSSPDQSSSVKDLSMIQGLLLYPNPAQNLLTIETVETVSVRVIDITGKEVISAFSILANGSETIAIDQLASGIYFLRSKNTQGSETNLRWVKK